MGQSSKTGSTFVTLFSGLLACISAIVELLLSHNPRIDSLTALGDTPLHGAMYGNRPEIVKMILDAGEIAIECSRKH